MANRQHESQAVQATTILIVCPAIAAVFVALRIYTLFFLTKKTFSRRLPYCRNHGTEISAATFSIPMVPKWYSGLTLICTGLRRGHARIYGIVLPILSRR